MRAAMGSGMAYGCSDFVDGLSADVSDCGVVDTGVVSLERLQGVVAMLARFYMSHHRLAGEVARGERQAMLGYAVSDGWTLAGQRLRFAFDIEGDTFVAVQRLGDDGAWQTVADAEEMQRLANEVRAEVAEGCDPAIELAVAVPGWAEPLAGGAAHVESGDDRA